jgi:hypothetical protein
MLSISKGLFLAGFEVGTAFFGIGAAHLGTADASFLGGGGLDTAVAVFFGGGGGLEGTGAFLAREAGGAGEPLPFRGGMLNLLKGQFHFRSLDIG